MGALSGALPCQSCCWPGIPLSSSQGRRGVAEIQGSAGHVVARFPQKICHAGKRPRPCQRLAAGSTALLREGRCAGRAPPVAGMV
jgi:hypothetical protein